MLYIIWPAGPPDEITRCLIVGSGFIVFTSYNSNMFIIVFIVFIVYACVRADAIIFFRLYIHTHQWTTYSNLPVIT